MKARGDSMSVIREAAANVEQAFNNNPELAEMITFKDFMAEVIVGAGLQSEAMNELHNSAQREEKILHATEGVRLSSSTNQLVATDRNKHV
jgi:copper homeostasis protein CutC